MLTENKVKQIDSYTPLKCTVPETLYNISSSISVIIDSCKNCETNNCLPNST